MVHCPTGPSPFAPTQDLPPRSFSLSFTCWRLIQSYGLESAPSKSFHFPHSPKSSGSNAQVLRKHCWMVLPDAVIYPNATPPGCECVQGALGRFRGCRAEAGGPGSRECKKWHRPHGNRGGIQRAVGAQGEQKERRIHQSRKQLRG